jgi:HPt (histidine-containing phosphotransfer) domain-containing protein
MRDTIEYSAGLPLNIGELRSRVDNDQELLREHVQLFKQECPRLMKSLHDAVSKEKMNALKTVSHSLKGMLGNLSATRAASAASSLEEIGRTRKHSQLRKGLAVLESEIAVLIPELDAWVADAHLNVVTRQNARNSLENFPDEVCQKSHHQEGADSADPEKEVGGQFRRVNFFFVHRG